jgi:hypothetical protein
MTTLADFRQSMARQGLLLPVALVNDINRQHEDGQLAALAAMAALARSLNPAVDLDGVDAIYATLNEAYPLEASGIFTFAETLGHLQAIRDQRLKDLGPSEFPMPAPLSLNGTTTDDLNRAAAARYTLSADDFSAGPDADQLSLFADLMAAAVDRARALNPERVGAPRPKSEADYPVGSPPTDMEPDLSTLPVD